MLWGSRLHPGGACHTQHPIAGKNIGHIFTLNHLGAHSPMPYRGAIINLGTSGKMLTVEAHRKRTGFQIKLGGNAIQQIDMLAQQCGRMAMNINKARCHHQSGGINTLFAAQRLHRYLTDGTPVNADMPDGIELSLRIYYPPIGNYQTVLRLLVTGGQPHRDEENSQ